MRYRYRILWFEDNLENIKERCEERLKKFLDLHGFELSVSWQPSKLARPSIASYQKYDLIVTDLNLSDGDTKDTAGVEILEQVRDYKVLTDVLVYSGSSAHLTKAQEKLGTPERVSFCATHDALPDKVERLIELGIRKVQNIENIRGLVITEAIDLERQIGEIAHQYFSREDAERLDSKVRRAKKICAGKVKFTEGKLKKALALKPTEVKTICKDENFTVFDHLQFLLGICDDACQFHSVQIAKEKDPARLEMLKAAKTAIARISKELNYFNTEIIGARNTLAHVKETPHGDDVILESRSKAGKLVINHAWCVKMRRDIRKHSSNILELKSLL